MSGTSRRYSPTNEWGFGTHQDFKLKEAVPYTPYDAKYKGVLAYNNNELFFGGATQWLKVLVTAGQFPQSIRFVSPNFIEGDPFYNSIANANDSFTGTIILYEGSYSVSNLTLTANILAIGEVAISGEMDINGIQISGDNLFLDEVNIASSGSVYCKNIASLSLTNASAEVRSYNTNYITITGTSNLTYNGRINNRLSVATGNGKVDIVSDYIREIDINGAFVTHIDCNYCLGLTVAGSSINFIDIKKLASTNNIQFGDASKTEFTHTNISTPLLFLQDESVVKLLDCHIVGGNGTTLINIESMNQLVIEGTRLSVTNGQYCIDSNASISVFLYPGTCSNMNYSGNILPLVDDVVVNTNVLNEILF